ncbi:MAG: hypothetical protein H6Q90_6498 [Deltaproteobacteria bacterium]|nr:hypothetical protein [Deltaproteobacteria bacterium]
MEQVVPTPLDHRGVPLLDARIGELELAARFASDRDGPRRQPELA